MNIGRILNVTRMKRKVMDFFLISINRYSVNMSLLVNLYDSNILYLVKFRQRVKQ